MGGMSTPQTRRVRKAPQARRAEIVACAAAIALADGLEHITLRRVAEDLAVQPGLINHYFPVAEDLVAEAFGDAATAELDELIPPSRPAGQPLEYLARFLFLTAGDRWDQMSRLWLNARHLSRYRPALRDRVGHQEALWRDRLAGLIGEGAGTGAFRAGDSVVAAIAILVVLDGLGAHANTGTAGRPPAVANMAVTTAERELGLPAGTLGALITTPRPAGAAPRGSVPAGTDQ
jgi:AcrR family transcriptional regulator